MSEPVRTFVINNGTHVFVVNRGPQGPVGPVGSPGDVTGPVVSVVGNLPTFSNTSGNTLADSGVALSSLAVAATVTAALATKQDTSPGLGLSQNSYTTAEKNKLAALSTGTFRGTFDDAALLTAGVPAGVANGGDYAYVVDPVPGQEEVLYIWDVVNEVWTKVAPGSTPSNGAEIKAALFAEPDTNNLNDARLALLNGAVQTTTFDSVIATLGGSTSSTIRTPIIDSTTARTLTIADPSKIIRLTNAAPCTLTLPDDATATWTLPHEIYFFIMDATPVLSPDVGVTVNNLAAVAGLTQYDAFTLKRVGPDEWDVYLGI